MQVADPILERVTTTILISRARVNNREITAIAPYHINDLYTLMAYNGFAELTDAFDNNRATVITDQNTLNWVTTLFKSTRDALDASDENAKEKTHEAIVSLLNKAVQNIKLEHILLNPVTEQPNFP